MEMIYVGKYQLGSKHCQGLTYMQVRSISPRQRLSSDQLVNHLHTLLCTSHNIKIHVNPPFHTQTLKTGNWGTGVGGLGGYKTENNLKQSIMIYM